ncbi:MAG: diacylglycerol kinase family lipid kinase [Bacillota bacterium]|nr:diacylglycerol kinase family lipid kinase [Bacillota bacterium]
MKKVLIIYNPVAGSEKGEEINFLLRKKLVEEFDYIISKKTVEAEDAYNFAKNACSQDFHAIFVVGGDGTINQVTKALLENYPNNRPVLGVFPGGTFNGVSRILGYPQNIRAAIRKLKFDKTIKMDVGKFNENYFNMIFSIGDIPESIHNVSNEEKSVFSGWAYAYNIAKDAIKNNHYLMEVNVDGQIIKGDFSHLIVMLSSALYGTPLINDIEKNDGYLHLFIVKESTLFDKMSIIPDLISGKIKNNEHIKYFKCKNIQIKSLDKLIETDIDGEKSDHLPANIEIISQAIEMYVLN